MRLEKLQFCNSCGKSHLFFTGIYSELPGFLLKDVPYQFFVVSCNRGSQQIKAFDESNVFTIDFVYLLVMMRRLGKTELFIPITIK